MLIAHKVYGCKTEHVDFQKHSNVCLQLLDTRRTRVLKSVWNEFSIKIHRTAFKCCSPGKYEVLKSPSQFSPQDHMNAKLCRLKVWSKSWMRKLLEMSKCGRQRDGGTCFIDASPDALFLPVQSNVHIWSYLCVCVFGKPLVLWKCFVNANAVLK